MEIHDDSRPTSHKSPVTSQIEEEARHLNAEDIVNLEIGAVTSGHWAGPMDPKLFLRRFLPQVEGSNARPDFQTSAFDSVFHQTDKREMSKALVSLCCRYL